MLASNPVSTLNRTFAPLPLHKGVNLRLARSNYQLKVERGSDPGGLRRRDTSLRIGRILVHGDGARVHGVGLRQRLAEEPFRRISVALVLQPKVDRLAAAVDGSIQIHPAALDLYVGLIDSPGVVAGAQVRPDPLLLGVELPPFEGLILPYLGSFSTFSHPHGVYPVRSAPQSCNRTIWTADSGHSEPYFRMGLLNSLMPFSVPLSRTGLVEALAALAAVSCPVR